MITASFEGNPVELLTIFESEYYFRSGAEGEAASSVHLGVVYMELFRLRTYMVGQTQGKEKIVSNAITCESTSITGMILARMRHSRDLCPGWLP